MENMRQANMRLHQQSSLITRSARLDGHRPTAMKSGLANPPEAVRSVPELPLVVISWLAWLETAWR